MKFNNPFKKVYISFQLSEEANQLLTESAGRSNRKKVQEARLRLDDHLKKYRSIAEIDIAILTEEKIGV